MMEKLYRLRDRLEEWWRYPQPSCLQKHLLGQYTDVIDTNFTAVRLASESSANYIQTHARTAANFAVDYDLHHWVCTTQLDAALLETGTVLEFGVATGRTINHLARWLPHNTIYGFDSFEGLPEDWTSRMSRGHFARSSLPKVRSNCELVVGWFDQTLPNFVQQVQQQKPLALLHVDSDLYSSAVCVLSNLANNIVPGTVIVFDEYINYPGWQQDEFKAWQEFCQQHQVKYEYIGLVSRHQKMAVRVLQKENSST